MKIHHDAHREMVRLFQEGASMREIGISFSVSRQRVSQIVRRAGVKDARTRYEARRRLESLRLHQEKQAKRDVTALELFGCTAEQHEELLEIGRSMMKGGASIGQTPTRAWQAQRQKARVRNIEWELSLWDWWMVWKWSGKWDMRGRGTGYMMCRFGDAGPYSLDNIYIATGSHNAALRKILRDQIHDTM
ncbi:hypothetical protein [Brucella sp.]|jgi:predicted DNA-binding protein YlxM (UPF0122 family)|uniref:hypothetical protein n=1 Tax=Brucella sp. TaxID=52132 RepID=UPI0028AA1E62|nr:hypothetical protein [Brucella sp.]